LVTFFVSIMIFLAAFGASLSSWVHGAAGGEHDFSNLARLAAFSLLGIGSYLLEALFLVWHRPDRPREMLRKVP